MIPEKSIHSLTYLNASPPFFLQSSVSDGMKQSNPNELVNELEFSSKSLLHTGKKIKLMFTEYALCYILLQTSDCITSLKLLLLLCKAGTVNTGVGKSRFIVVHMENNNIRINFQSSLLLLIALSICTMVNLHLSTSAFFLNPDPRICLY